MNTDDMRLFIIDGQKSTYKEAQILIKTKLDREDELEQFIDRNWDSVNVIGRSYRPSEVAEAMEGRKKLLSTATDYILSHPEKFGITTVSNIRTKRKDVFRSDNNRMGKKWKG